jgi:hypothetical protein
MAFLLGDPPNLREKKKNQRGSWTTRPHDFEQHRFLIGAIIMPVAIRADLSSRTESAA